MCSCDRYCKHFIRNSFLTTVNEVYLQIKSIYYHMHRIFCGMYTYFVVKPLSGLMHLKFNGKPRMKLVFEYKYAKL